MITLEFPDFGDFKSFSKISFDEKDIPKDAVKTETITEKDGYRTVITVYEKEGYYCSISKRELIPDPVNELKIELNKAIAEQRFEDAAKLRDQIADLQK